MVDMWKLFVIGGAGVEPFGGQVCTLLSDIDATAAVAIGPCTRLQDQNVNQGPNSITNDELCPVYTQTSSSAGLTEFKVSPQQEK